MDTSLGEVFGSWESREASIWVNSLNSLRLWPVAVSCVVRVAHQVFETGKLDLWFSAIALGLGMSVYGVWSTRKRDVNEAQAAAKLFFNLLQVYLVAIVVRLQADFMVLWVIMSTIIFCMHEIQSFQSHWYSLLVLLRQICMWQWAYWYLGMSISSAFPWWIALMIVVMTVIFADQLRKRSKDTWLYYESMRKEREKLRAILEAIPQGLIVITEKMEVSCCNSAALDLVKVSGGEVKTYLQELHCRRELTEPQSPEPLYQHMTSFLEKDTSSAVFGITNESDEYTEWKGTKCQWNESSACILTATNISSWVKSQNTLKQESESKSAVLRFVSHELRTPANAILNMTANVMGGDNILPDQKTQLSIVITSTHFLLSVVNDLLDFTRMAADKFSLVKQSFDVRKEIQDTVELLRIQCEKKGLFLTTNFDPLIPDVVFSDAARMKQVVLNLLGNALKFTFQGGIRIIVTLTNHGTIRVAVSDNGIGIPSDKIAGLGKVFATVEGTQRVNPQGCGLGLYISNLLARSLGSRPISIESTLGMGSTFSFEVNIYQKEVTECDIDDGSAGSLVVENERDREELLYSSEFTGGNHPEDFTYPDILIVDDSEFNRLVLVKMLERLNTRTDEAETGLRALAKVRTAIQRNHYYRLILMDMEMPEMDGITATQEIRSMEITGELRVRPRIVCCSAHRSAEDVERSLNAGMDDYIEKPIDKEKLLALLNQTI